MGPLNAFSPSEVAGTLITPFVGGPICAFGGPKWDPGEGEVFGCYRVIIKSSYTYEYVVNVVW